MTDATRNPIDVSDAALRRDGDRLLYRDEPFTGRTIESYPDGVDRYEREFRSGHPASTRSVHRPDLRARVRGFADHRTPNLRRRVRPEGFSRVGIEGRRATSGC